MIRLRPFRKMSYGEMRDEYLKRLVIYDVVEFDESDILNNGSRKSNGKSSRSYETLEHFPELRDYLYDENKAIIRDNLRQILVGPNEAPRSLGGKGEFATMRSVFNKIISDIEGRNFSMTENAVDACKKVFKYKRLNIVRKRVSVSEAITESGKITEPAESEATAEFKEIMISKEPVAYWLQNQLGVKVCPYCNRMYATTLYGKRRTRPDFDHFYPQSRYPYLTVSLFNLIPSCNVCNKAKLDYAEIKENFKKESKKTKCTYRQKKSIIYPYDESYNESQGHISFRVIPDEMQYGVMMGRSDKFTIELRPTKYSDKLEFKNLAPTKTELAERFKCQVNTEIDDDAERTFWERAKQTIELLRLEDFYNEHKLEIMKILRIHYEYNRIAKQFIMHPLNVSAITAQMELMSNRDLIYFAFLKPEEWGNTPLNKLKSDILKQLEEIEKTCID